MSERSPAELAFDLIKAATEPNSAKRVQELVAAKKAYEAEVAKAKAYNDEAERKLDAAYEALETAKAKEADTEAKRVRLVRHEDELAEKKRDLDRREQQVLDKERAAHELHRQTVESRAAHDADRARWAKESSAARSKLETDRATLDQRIKEARSFLRL